MRLVSGESDAQASKASNGQKATNLNYLKKTNEKETKGTPQRKRIILQDMSPPQPKVYVVKLIIKERPFLI